MRRFWVHFPAGSCPSRSALAHPIGWAGDKFAQGFPFPAKKGCSTLFLDVMERIVGERMVRDPRLSLGKTSHDKIPYDECGLCCLDRGIRRHREEYSHACLWRCGFQSERAFQADAVWSS